MGKLADFKAPVACTLEELIGIVVDRIKDTVAAPVMYDLGCGDNKPPNFLGVDLYSDKADVKHDLFYGDWSFTPDNSVDFFHSSHFVEHVPDMAAFMRKAHAKLKDDGFMLITTPFGNSDRAWQDPDHKQVITINRYWYFNKKSRINMGVDHVPHYNSVNFDILNAFPVWNREFANLGEKQKEYHMAHTWNAVDDLTVLLRKKPSDVD